jgi:hypothetical protein
MKKVHVILLLIFLFVLGARLYYSFSTPYLSSDESYFNLRQIESIKDTGKPIIHDSLSYSGRTFIFTPGFHYLLAFLSYIFPLAFVVKFFPNLFAASIVIFTYLIAKKITKKAYAALFTAFISGFIPVYFNETFNSLSVYSLFIPLMFFLLYCFLNIKKQFYIYLYIILLIILSLIHPSIVIFGVALIIYLLLIKLEKIPYDKAELELIIFSLFFILWIQSIMLKKLFLFHGPLIIWQNIPQEILTNYFSKITILEGIYNIGILPFFYGIYMIYNNLFKKKNKQIYLLIAFALTIGLLLWLRMVKVQLGLIFLGIILTILFSEFYSYYTSYIRTTRAARFLNMFIFLLFLAFFLTSIIPSLALAKNTAEHSVVKDKILALQWISRNSAEDATILASIDEGNLITAISERKNVFDSNFLLIKNSDEIFNDVERIFVTRYSTEAIKLLSKYSVDYIFFSQDVKDYYNINSLSYISHECFELAYENKNVAVYKPLCRMEERHG